MSAIVKNALILAGSGSLFVGSMVGISMLSGRPLHELPGLSSLAPETPTGTRDGGTDGSAEAQLPPDPQAASQVMRATAPSASTAGVLGAFVLPAPFSTAEISALQESLLRNKAEADARLARLSERERHLEEWERSLTGRVDELKALQAALDRRQQELELRETETNRDGKARAEAERRSWSELSKFFAEGDPEAMVQRLIALDPQEAVKILKGLDDERASALMNALPPDRYKAYLEAYRTTPK